MGINWVFWSFDDDDDDDHDDGSSLNYCLKRLYSSSLTSLNDQKNFTLIKLVALEGNETFKGSIIFPQISIVKFPNIKHSINPMPISFADIHKVLDFRYSKTHCLFVARKHVIRMPV